MSSRESDQGSKPGAKSVTSAAKTKKVLDLIKEEASYLLDMKVILILSVGYKGGGILSVGGNPSFAITP